MNNSTDPAKNSRQTTQVRAPQWFANACAFTPDSNYFDYQGARIHYLSWNDKHQSHNAKGHEKPVLLFCHGFRGHSYWWSFVAPFFIEHYKVYALDFSGMGDSGFRETYDANIHVDEILAFIEHLGVLKVSLVAHSYAGGRSFRAAQKKPAVFEKIIAIDSYLGFEGDTYDTDPVPYSNSRYYPSLAAGMQRFRVVPPQDKVEPWINEHIAKYSLKAVDGQWTWKFDPNLGIENLLATDGEEVMAAVKCKVDFIYGDESIVISSARAHKTMAATANKGRLIVMPGGHHHMMVSNPEALIATLQALL